MAKKEVTSKKAASVASEVLRSKNSSKAAKSAAVSALTQRPNKRKNANQAFNPLAKLALTTLTRRCCEVYRYQENSYFFHVFSAIISGRLT